METTHTSRVGDLPSCISSRNISSRFHIAVVTSHPIQYQAPWFRALTSFSDVDLQVLFCHQATPSEQAAAGFGVEFDWDGGLLEGYRSRFLVNVAAKPSVHTFFGLDTPELTEIIKRHKYDAVIVAGWHYKSAWQAIRACWKSQTPVMVRSDSHLHSNRSGVKSVGKWPFYRWFIPRFDACLPVGQWSREYFMHYGARPEKIFIVPHAVDDTFFSRELKRLTICRAELCSEWNLDVEAPVFLFAGKFVENKRPLDFLKAIDLIVKRGADVAGLMVGDGPLRGACEAFVSRERLPVRFTGFLNQSDMPKAYVVSNALVLPSEGETWGLVVNEAMIGGVPAFVSDQVGCAPDMISDGQTGYVYPVGNIEALAEFMFWFARDKPKQQHMGGEAEKKARSYSAMCGAQATLNAVRSVVGVQGRQS